MEDEIVRELALRAQEAKRNNITMDDYQVGTGTTAIYPGKGTIMGLMYTALGLGESGEVQGKVKKVLRDSDGVLTDEAHDKIVDELGDLLWYVGQMCSELNVSMGEVAWRNLEKLADRKARGALKGDGDNR